MSKSKINVVIVPQERVVRNARITKLEDTKFNGKHPNKINVGYVKEGILWQAPIVGQSCCVGSICTSVVTELINEGSFRTENSVYQIEYL
jgi:hypothetical protein